MWEEVARQVTDQGAELHCGKRVEEIEPDDSSINQLTIEDRYTGSRSTISPGSVGSAIFWRV
jgi:glycerol-3-phosphate dehydrogenase